MSDPETTVLTAYGRLDRASLTRLQSTYDTSKLLRAVEQLDAAGGEEVMLAALQERDVRPPVAARACEQGGGRRDRRGVADRDMPHVAYRVDSIAEAAKGLKVLIEPFDVPMGKVGFFQTADGAVVEFMEYTKEDFKWHTSEK